MILALDKKSQFNKTYVQIRMVLEEDNSARTLEGFLDESFLNQLQDIILLLSILSQMILSLFNVIDKLTKMTYLTAACDLGLQVFLGYTVTRLLVGEVLSWTFSRKVVFY